jgi:transcriptional regulator with XRE-family HTH domain
MDNPIPHTRNRLQSERQRRGWSRKYVAEQLDVSDYTVGQWERGEHMPYPMHIQKLCNLFDTSAEALGLTGLSAEVNPLEVHKVQVDTGTLTPHPKRWRLLLAIVGIVLVLVVAAGVSRYILFPVHVKPGGVWISPIGTTVRDVMHFAAYAYPTNQGDPDIDYVNFTMYWPGIDPHAWKIACVVHVPISKDVYACDVNLRLLGATPGPISISFDVYDRQGNVNEAPNGVHHINYVPS